MTIIKKVLNRINSLVKTIISSEQGFSLMELMIVITIMGILSLLIVPKLMDIPRKARIEAGRQQISAFGMALDRYYLDNGVYPSGDQGLSALVQKPSSEPMPMNYNPGGYMKKKEIPNDPWGRAFIYAAPGPNENDYGISSLGADGRDGGEGENADLNSWD